MEQPWVPNPGGLAPVPGGRLTPDALRSRFAAPPAWTPDAQDINPARAADQTMRLASVLIPLVMRSDGIHVMLTQRTAHLHDHAGQVSFPGGRVEQSDPTVADAALRETEEETGLPRSLVEIIGQLPDYFTGTGFRVVPLVGLVQPDFQPVPDPFEVAEVFEVPLGFLMDPANHRLHRASLPAGEVRTYYSMPWRQFFIWGATAGMLRNLYQFLRA
ncbi:MAG: CoA pyrophosphatase [Pigmentiphaga sp.]|uniref:CoA pyrophosphatase n=1 Tax=Pigmentiphaga sp. TaxID=1977564 RepID=UPI0029AB7B51|nr:CoA pyrophosphatase [Pigmentiphaga sp.]MDX3907573.1 CoA pyrophosphatase [Pigmentiphaga sp.]